MNFPNTDWPAVVRRFNTARVLVVGDVMLDRYWYGTVARVSPEAPVVVISKTRAVFAPGGAGNAATNIAALGGHASLIGVAGEDDAAAQMLAALRDRGVEDVHLLKDAGRPTTVKTRVVAHHQHVVRIDEESAEPLPEILEKRLLVKVEERLAGARAVVLSDYAKGVLTDTCVRSVIALACRSGIPVFVDPKARDADRYQGAALIKPNRTELGVLTNRGIADHDAAVSAAAALLAQLPGTSALVTEGAEGMTLLCPGAAPVSFSGRARKLYDVTGAGDTVIATVALAVASGCDLPAACHLAAHAAARVIEKLGTDVCTAEDLIAGLAEP